MTDVPLIDIRDLQITFHGDDGRTTHAVDRVDLSVARGATLGLVGESGCGKSVTSLAIMGLLSKQSSEVTGSIRFDGFDLLDVPDQTLRDLRGNRLAMIFQEPMTSLNPSFTIGDQIIETILRHRGGSRRSARERTIELLRRVHIPSPERRIDEYPHKLSGGMRQRVMIAMAQDGLDDLVADGEARIERGHRLLEDHRQAVAAEVAQGLVGHFQQVEAVETDRAGDFGRLFRQQAHDGQ